VNSEWLIENKYANAGKFERFAGNCPREYASLFTNLDRVVRHLNGGAKIGGFQIGFFRSEGGGVYRIGQSAVAYAKESRLYVFPHQLSMTMYILTIGTKDRQADDIQEARTMAERIKGEIETEQTTNHTGE
jgi:hypothetical protein